MSEELVVYLKDLSIRVIKTFAQAMLASMGAFYVGIHEVPWGYHLSIGVYAAVLTVLFNLSNFPGVVSANRTPILSASPAATDLPGEVDAPGEESAAPLQHSDSEGLGNSVGDYDGD